MARASTTSAAMTRRTARIGLNAPPAKASAGSLELSNRARLQCRREALDPQLEADSGRWRLSALHRVPAVPQSTTERACHFTAGALLAWHWGAKLRTGEFGLWRLSPHRRLRGKTAASGAGSTRSPTISSAATR